MKKAQGLLLVLVFGLCVFLIRPQEALAAVKEWYVAPGASAAAACTRADPCDFATAVEIRAGSGDIIYARSGTYTRSNPTLLYIHKSLTLYGSCEFDEFKPVTCDPSLRNSILDGEYTRRVITIQGGGGPPYPSVHIEGFQIINGNATAMGPGMCSSVFGSVSGCGGGILAKTLQSLTLNNLTLHYNIGGNTGGVGGGIYAENIYYIDVQNSTIKSNIAAGTGYGRGGGMLVFDSGKQNSVYIKNNLFDRNETSSNELSVTQGAGLYIFDSSGVKITENIFQANNNLHRRMVYGSSIFINGASNFLIDHNKFQFDWGYSVIHLRGYSIYTNGYVSRNSFWQNDDYQNIGIFGPVKVVVENNFLGFRTPPILSENRGGSSSNIYIVGDDFNLQDAQVGIYFNTFAAADYGVQLETYSDVEIVNNIFTELNEKAIDVDTFDLSISCSSSYNLFFNNWDDGDDIGFPAIFEDPKLANISLGDFHLTHGSAAINRVSAPGFDIDIDGDHRPVGTGNTPFDLGADEYNPKLYLPLIMN